MWQRCSDRGRLLFPGRIDISQRPWSVADGIRFGDWEADLVCTFRDKAQSKTASGEELVLRLCEIPPSLREDFDP